MAQDSSQPDFWETRYRENFTPWDAGFVPQAFKDFISTSPTPGRALIPGCGSAYEARYLAAAGWDVMAIDFSPAAVKAARKTLGPFGHVVKLADFFQFDYGKPFDLVYERTFLCALPRRLWPQYAGRMAEVLRPGALLVGFFYYNEEKRGPPFGTSEGELNRLLGNDFERIADSAISDSILLFVGKERWQVWRRILK